MRLRIQYIAVIKLRHIENTIDDAFQTIRRSFKLPLVMGSMSSKKNKELYNVLVYNKPSKDQNINEAATVLRDQVLGNIIQEAFFDLFCNEEEEEQLLDYIGYKRTHPLEDKIIITKIITITIPYN